MPSSARMRAAVLPATKAPKVRTRRWDSGRSESGRSDKAVLPPAGDLGGGVAKLVDEHRVGMGASWDGDQVGGVERPVDVQRRARHLAHAELGMGERAERTTLVLALVGHEFLRRVQCRA